MKVAHLSDIHFCPKHLEEVSRCTAFALKELHKRKPDLAILSGDLFDHRLDQNAPALLAAVEFVQALADICPVLILQGTYSHDVPGALDIFWHVRAEHEVFVADRIGQIIWSARTGFDTSDGWGFDGDSDTPAPFMWDHGIPGKECLLISAIPSINKGAVAAAVGAEAAAEAAGENVAKLLAAWAPSHRKARAAGVASIVVGHGTVNESISEHGVPMAGLDHEFTVGALFAAEATAVMLGHIHKHQNWTNGAGRVIAYPGSLGRLHFGEIDPKGFILWDLKPECAEYDFIETPAKRLVDIEFQGPPDMGELQRLAADATGAHVRIRWTVDEEHRSAVDREAIAALFEAAEEVKLEGTITPIQRQRAAGIGQATSIGEKLVRWGEVTQTETGPLLERLSALESKDVETIVQEIA